MKENKVTIMIIVFVIIMLVIGFNFFSNHKKINSLEEKIEILMGKIEKTEDENKELKKEIENLNDLEYIEKIARKNLGLVKPGEVLLIPVEKDEEKETNE